jgi:hypothetical protein
MYELTTTTSKHGNFFELSSILDKKNYKANENTRLITDINLNYQAKFFDQCHSGPETYVLQLQSSFSHVRS